jgi:hypothetical protein
MRLSFGFLFIGLVLSCSSACRCSDGGQEEQEPPAGRIEVAVDGATATLSLVGLSTALRSVQVDVEIEGGQASALVGARAWDLVEAGLTEAPRSSFTVVIADTRRLPIDNGPLAVVTLTEGSRVSLRNALAIDERGARHTLSAEVAP